MYLPNAERAVVDRRKLEEYCLSPTHDEGKHKARLFATSLDMHTDDADELLAILLHAVKTYEAEIGKRDVYGQRYVIDFPLTWRGRHAILRSAWIVEHGSDIPRLTTCYPM